MRTTRLIRLAVGVLGISGSVASAQSGTAVVNTQMSTYLAGGNTYGISPSGGGGLLPFAVTLNAGTGRVLTFSSVTGTATFCPGGACGTPSPDGPSIGGTSLTSSGSISGILSSSSGFLAGVFLGGSLPLVAPASLNFANLNFLSTAPLLGQQFFIGNGFTSTAVQQQFFVPDGATMLYFGIADGGAFNGSPGFYADNVGSYTAIYNVAGNISTVPEPSTVALLAAGLVAVGYVRTRRRATGTA